MTKVTQAPRGHGLLVHATIIGLSVDADGPLCGVALLGPAGAGKSRLALELIARCPDRRSCLVADDAAILTYDGDQVHAAAPAPLAGAMEVWGTGIIHLPAKGPLAVRFALNVENSTERQPGTDPWQPFGDAGPTVPTLQMPPNGAVRPLIRSLLTGHSVLGGFDRVIGIEAKDFS